MARPLAASASASVVAIGWNGFQRPVAIVVIDTSVPAAGARPWVNAADALPLVHVDLAGAVALTDTVGLTAGFATTSYALVEPRDETFVHTLALGGRYRDRHVTVDLALEVPVDARDRAVDTLMATAAVAWRL